MACSLSKYTVETETHYVGNDGTLYPLNEYTNHGKGGVYKGLKDLPHDNYPYTFKLINKFKFKCCEICKCDNKPII